MGNGVGDMWESKYYVMEFFFFFQFILVLCVIFFHI